MPGDFLQHNKLRRGQPGREGKLLLTHFRSAKQAANGTKGRVGARVNHAIQLALSGLGDKCDFVSYIKILYAPFCRGESPRFPQNLKYAMFAAK